MRETAFIKRNKQKWLEFEQSILGNVKKRSDELAHLYIQLVNDLSFAQTFYPKSKTTVYLNYLAAQTYQKIYKTKREDTNRFVYFFKREVPLLVYENAFYVKFAFALFFIFVGVGVLSSVYDQDFSRLILGDGYVNTTIENIKAGNPVAIYKSGSDWGSFIGITFNNLRVGILSYIAGVTGGLLTFYILLSNCVMLGTFQHMFYQYNVFWESVRGIWIHGAMEIFAIVIEAACGFMLGASILFPKTYSRTISFKIGFKNSFKIAASTFPFTIAAGFLEGFITRYSIDMPKWLSIGIILSTLAFIGFYYLIYPKIVFNKLKPKL